MLRPLFLALSLVLTVPAMAQPAAPAASSTAAAAAPAGIQSQNILDLKPDASADPKYMSQTNGERNKVQPGNSAPMWRGVAAGNEGFSSLPKREAPEAGVLIQAPVQYPGSRLTTAGEAWRQVRNNWIIPYGGALLLIVLGAVAIFHFTKGPMRLHSPETGRKMERFTAFERSAHWANAGAFVLLAISGVVMAFGKFFLLPVMGTMLFGWLSYALKNIHNFAGPVFAVSLVVVILTFLRDNWPARGDLNWLLKGGGLLGEHEVPSGRYNAGEKLVFWAGVFLLGLIVVGSGLVMDKLVPGLVYERSTMQVANMIHGVAAVLMLVVFIGHIYLGTVGTPGALEGMRTGYVDETWAREHHELWYNDVKSGKIPASREKPARAAEPPATGATA